MVKNIKINLEAIEGMLYFWQAASEKENVSEMFFYDVSEMRGYKLIYDNEFNKESVTKVLSAIKNRELLSNATQKEKRYWNYNMWVMEDLEYTRFMADPVKRLNLDNVLKKISVKASHSKYEEVEVIFVPLHLEDYCIKENSLIINFFKVKPDDLGDGGYIGDVNLEEFIEEKILEMI
jgi:hypothetical protein